MKSIPALAAGLLLATAFAPAPALANAAAVEATQACFADSTNGKDRKLLGKWIFLALAGHPEIRGFSSATDQDHERISQELAALFMRLVTEDCAGEMRTLAEVGGSEALKLPFEYLGQIAMQELMSNKDVAGKIGHFEKFLDERKLNEVFAPVGN